VGWRAAIGIERQTHTTAKFSGEQRPELQDPAPHGLVGDIQSALGEQILDITETESETNIKPNGVTE
jgi:hypothetical protein